jgi:hypothetical protein
VIAPSPCPACRAGLPRLTAVTLAHMPSGWAAKTCIVAPEAGGHLEPALPDHRRALPSGEMTMAQAREIVWACIAHVSYQMGISNDPPPSLREYSLGELLEANRRVEAENKRVQNLPGRQSFHMTCADRLVAALYVAYWYPGDPPSSPEPVVLANGNMVLIVDHRAAVQEAAERAEQPSW